MLLKIIFTIIIKIHCLGYAWAEDKEHCEENGRMLNADSSKVSMRARKRGLPQVKYFLILSNKIFKRNIIFNICSFIS